MGGGIIQCIPKTWLGLGDESDMPVSVVSRIAGVGCEVHTLAAAGGILPGKAAVEALSYQDRKSVV